MRRRLCLRWHIAESSIIDYEWADCGCLSTPAAQSPDGFSLRWPRLKRYFASSSTRHGHALVAMLVLTGNGVPRYSSLMIMGCFGFSFPRPRYAARARALTPRRPATRLAGDMLMAALLLTFISRQRFALVWFEGASAMISRFLYRLYRFSRRHRRECIQHQYGYSSRAGEDSSPRFRLILLIVMMITIDIFSFSEFIFPFDDEP